MTPTPLVKLENFYLKREDQNPTGSAKDRAVSLQVENLIKKGIKSAVISSTGNAAISAIYYCSKSGINLTVFLSPKINQEKLSYIKKQTNNIIFSDKPISQAFKFAKKNKYFLLRQSTDLVAQMGYQSIGLELSKELPEITSLFIPVGSGTTLLGISKGLPEKTKIFAVQPANHCPISSAFDHQFSPEAQTVTDALSVKLLPLKSQVLETITKSNGGGVVVQNAKVIETWGYLSSKDIITSSEGALALAGLIKAKEQNIDIGNYPVVLLTGKKR